MNARAIKNSTIARLFSSNLDLSLQVLLGFRHLLRVGRYVSPGWRAGDIGRHVYLGPKFNFRQTLTSWQRKFNSYSILLHTQIMEYLSIRGTRHLHYDPEQWRKIANASLSGTPQSSLQAKAWLAFLLRLCKFANVLLVKVKERYGWLCLVGHGYT